MKPVGDEAPEHQNRPFKSARAKRQRRLARTARSRADGPAIAVAQVIGSLRSFRALRAQVVENYRKIRLVSEARNHAGARQRSARVKQVSAETLLIPYEVSVPKSSRVAKTVDTTGLTSHHAAEMRTGSTLVRIKGMTRGTLAERSFALCVRFLGPCSSCKRDCTEECG